MVNAQTPQARLDWIKVLDQIIHLDPTIVIPAHGKAGDSLDIHVLKHTKDYLLFMKKR